VTEIQRYLAEELAEDHADGLVSRREALRRLGLLGLGGGPQRPCSREPSWIGRKRRWVFQPAPERRPIGGRRVTR
jgi:hypothetical protein